MNDFQFVSEDYSIHNSKNHRLSIQFNPDGFSVLILNSEKKAVKILHRQTGSSEEIHKAFKTEENLIKLRELSFSSVRLLLNHSRINLIPAHENYKSRFRKLFSLEFEDPSGTVISHQIPGSDVQCNFEISGSQQSLIQAFRNNPTVSHTGISLITDLLEQEGSTNLLRAYTTPGLMHIAVSDEQNLLFYNVFSWESEEEMIYHFMNTYRNFTSDDIVVEYAGHLQKKSDSLKLLNSYIPDLVIVPNKLSFGIAWDVNENYFSYLF